jgi:cell wall-associated NlpC family hydrolase
MYKVSWQKRFLFLIIFIVLFVFVVSMPSFASPFVSSLKSQKQALIRQLDELDAELDEAVEAYNEAVWKLSLTKSQARKLEARIKDTEAKIAVIEARMAKRARTIYMLKTNPLLEALLESESLADVITGMRMLSEVLNTEANLSADYKVKKEKLEKDRQELARVLAEQKRLVRLAAARKRAIEAKVREKERLLASIDARIRAAIQRERQSRSGSLVAVNFDSYRSRIYNSRGSDREDGVRPNSDTSIGLKAVSIAYSLLGRPYRWGAAGPGAFDCSGLTMYIYAQLGIYLPHSSAAQYYSGTRVSYDELAPGDLVFFARRSGRISHVGIYIGGGMMIHAPQTGDVVRIAPLSEHGGYVGAVRPY